MIGIAIGILIVIIMRIIAILLGIMIGIIVRKLVVIIGVQIQSRRSPGSSCLPGCGSAQSQACGGLRELFGSHDGFGFRGLGFRGLGFRV